MLKKFFAKRRYTVSAINNVAATRGLIEHAFMIQNSNFNARNLFDLSNPNIVV